jgi:hypothetical protein
VFDDELNRIAAEVGSRRSAFALAKADHKLVRFYLPLVPDDPEQPVWSVIRKLADRIGEGVTTQMRAIARENPLLQGIILLASMVVVWNRPSSGATASIRPRLLPGLMTAGRAEVQDVVQPLGNLGRVRRNLRPALRAFDGLRRRLTVCLGGCRRRPRRRLGGSPFRLRRWRGLIALFAHGASLSSDASVVSKSSACHPVIPPST